MIIPRAIFLYYTYRKGLYGKFDSIKQESQRVIGQIVVALRNPDTHQQGEIHHTFLATQYPRLSQDRQSIIWDNIRTSFIQAGYIIDVQHHSNGFSIYLNWKVFPNLPG